MATLTFGRYTPQWNVTPDNGKGSLIRLRVSFGQYIISHLFESSCYYRVRFAVELLVQHVRSTSSVHWTILRSSSALPRFWSGLLNLDDETLLIFIDMLLTLAFYWPVVYANCNCILKVIILWNPRPCSWWKWRNYLWLRLIEQLLDTHTVCFISRNNSRIKKLIVRRISTVLHVI